MLNKCCHCWHSSVQFSCSVVSGSLWPHELQHARPPCPSPTPGVHSDSRPSSQWCHPAISSSIVPFSSCPQSLPASESFPMSQLFAWGGQSTGVAALASVLPKNTQVTNEYASFTRYCFLVPIKWAIMFSPQTRNLQKWYEICIPKPTGRNQSLLWVSLTKCYYSFFCDSFIRHHIL